MRSYQSMAQTQRPNDKLAQPSARGEAPVLWEWMLSGRFQTNRSAAQGPITPLNDRYQRLGCTAVPGRSQPLEDCGAVHRMKPGLPPLFGVTPRLDSRVKRLFVARAPPRREPEEFRDSVAAWRLDTQCGRS